MPPTNSQLPANSPLDSAEFFLDDAFERAIEALQRGEQPSAESLAAARPNLQAQVQHLIGAAHRLVARQPATEAAPRDIPGYRLIGELGRGGMGIVHRAQQLNLANREVALKLLPAGIISVARFSHESRAIARLHHPGIIAIYDVIASDDGPAAIAMELVDGPSLSRLIACLSELDPLSHSDHSALGKRSASAANLMDRARDLLGTPRDASGASPALSPSYPVFICRLGSALARALEAVHEAGLIHRDTKPANILLRRDGSPVLTDFGLARDLATDATMHTQTGAFLGTAAYAPPEQIRGEHERIDARSDIYSLGATLFHALSLRPMPARSPAEAFRFFERGHTLPPLRKLNPRIPRDLETIIAKATDPDPSRRYPSAADLADDLDRVLTIRPIRARPVSVVGRTWRAARRNRAALTGAMAGGSLVLLLALGTLAYALFVPARVRAHVTEARLAVLDPFQIDHLGAVSLRAVSPGPDQSGLAPSGLEKAVVEFDGALRLAPWRNDLRLEREAVAAALLALRTERGPEPDALPSVLRNRAPAAVEYLASLAKASGSSLAGKLPSSDASPQDLRTVGLIGFLVGDADSAYAAWNRMASVSTPDGFVQAALGEIDLQRRDWASMYSRMYEAVAEFPDAAFLTIQLADAAVHVGRLADAGRLLALAETQPRQDPHESEKRAWAGYYAAIGQDEKAVELFEYFRHSKQHPAAREAYGRYLMSRGRFRDGMVVFQELWAIRDQPRFRRLFLEACRVWLTTAEPAEQAAARAGTLAGMYHSECAMAMHDAVEAEVASLPPAKPPLEAAASRTPSDGTLPPALEWLTRHMDDCCEMVQKSR